MIRDIPDEHFVTIAAGPVSVSHWMPTDFH